MSSVSTDRKDGHGLKLEQVGPTFYSIPAESPKNIMIGAP